MIFSDLNFYPHLCYNYQMKKVNIRRKINPKIFEVISECIKISEISGIKIYLVGGIVRDILLSKPLHDVDITVEGSVKEFVEILDCYVKTKSIKYNATLPTAKVVFANGTDIDFASTREEIYDKYGDLPRVTQVGCNIEKDIKRRDFTINSLVISLNRENLFELIDFTNGLNDLKNKKLRVLHDKSFLDDPSRMIRGLKFAQRLNFELDEETKILQESYLKNPLKNIPLERVKNEIIDLFSLNFASCFDQFTKQKLYKIFDINYADKIVGYRIKSALTDFKVNKDDIWRLYFLPVFASGEIPDKINFSSREKKIIENLHDFSQNEPIFIDNYSIFEYFKNKDYLTAVFYGIYKNEEIAKKYFKIKNIKPEITGYDLKKEGFREGKIFSEIQKAILKEKINNNLSGKENEINFIRKNFT